MSCFNPNITFYDYDCEPTDIYHCISQEEYELVSGTPKEEVYLRHSKMNLKRFEEGLNNKDFTAQEIFEIMYSIEKYHTTNLHNYIKKMEKINS